MEKRHSVKAPSLVRCGGCGEMFEPERRNQHYHDEVCKQKAYRERTKGCATPFCKRREELNASKLIMRQAPVTG